MTIVNALAPPGGCRDRVNVITKIAKETAAAIAKTGSGTLKAISKPVIADKPLPPMTGHGWANGLEGTAKTSTAEAPMGATNNGSCVPSKPLIQAARMADKMPTNAPTQASIRS